MYLLAGGITVLWAFVVYFFLPPDPIRARGFTDREKYVAVARVRINNSGVRNTHWKFPQVIEALKDGKFWVMFFIILLSSVPAGCFSTVSYLFPGNIKPSLLMRMLTIAPADQQMTPIIIQSKQYSGSSPNSFLS